MVKFCEVYTRVLIFCVNKAPTYHPDLKLESFGTKQGRAQQIFRRRHWEKTNCNKLSCVNINAKKTMVMSSKIPSVE